MNTINAPLSFGEKYKFLQNQQGLYCAYCGKTILSDAELKNIRKNLEGKKGIQIAKIFQPYVELFNDKDVQPIKQIIKLASDEKYKDYSFKNLAMHLDKKDIYTPDAMQTLKNLLRPICFSVEHTVPKSLGGQNNAANYIPMHISCNSGRSSESYAQVMIQNPMFATNIRKSLGQIRGRILSDKTGSTHFRINLPDDYIEKVTDNIASQGIDRTLIMLV